MPITASDIRFTPELSEEAIEIAMKLFRLRQERNIHIEVNPAWEMLTELYYQRALLGERGSTDQQQCIMQGIRLAVWYSGQIPAPWSKAFPLPYEAPRVSLALTVRQRALSWCRQIRDVWRRLRSKINDYLQIQPR